MSHIKLADIAKKLNLSINTVSIALNDKRGVSEVTRARIKETAKEMNYQPNVIAHNLRVKQTRTIGVVIDDNANPFFAKILKGIEDIATSNNYSIIFCNTDHEVQKEMQAIDILIQNRVEGIIIHPSSLTDNLIERVKNAYIPFVFIGSKPDNLNVDYVGNDNEQGSYMMTKYLLNKGYKEITLFNLKQNTTPANDRLLGFKRALNECNLTLSKEQIVNINFEQGAYDETIKLFNECGKLPRCIFCYCDIFASDVMMAIYDLGLKIPYDIALAGYDNIHVSANLRIPLTTVNQPKYDIGCKSAEILIERLNKKSMSHNPINIIYKPELVIREST